MAHVIDEPHAEVITEAIADAALSPLDVLSAAASGGWEVEQAIDPSGDVSIIVLPANDDPLMPTFMLYQERGRSRVAVIRSDVWESDKTFSSCRRAVAAIIAATSALAVAA